MFGSASSLKSGAQGESLLSHSQQLRSEFTFLLRSLDQCGGETTVDNGQRGSGSQNGSIVLFSYALEVALTLVRFDVLLNQEERKLLVHAFDRLLLAELTSLHCVEQRLHYCAETAASLRALKQRCPVLDNIDWLHVIAKCAPLDGHPLSQSHNYSHHYLNSPQTTEGHALHGEESTATTPLSTVTGQQESLPGPIVGEPLAANAARIYSSILVNGTIPASALPPPPPPPSKQSTVVIDAPMVLEVNDATTTATLEKIVVMTNDEFTVLAGSAGSSHPPFLAATPLSPQATTNGGGAAPQLPTVHYSPAPAFPLSPQAVKWALDAFTNEKCRGSNLDNYALTQVIPVVYPSVRNSDVSFTSTALLDTVGLFQQLRATLAPTTGPFAPIVESTPPNASVVAPPAAAAATTERRTSIKDDDECYSLASTVNEVSPAATAEPEYNEIVRKNISSSVANKSVGMSRVSSQVSIDAVALNSGTRSTSSAGLTAATAGRQSSGPAMATTSAPKPTLTPSRLDLTSGSPVSVEGVGAATHHPSRNPLKRPPTVKETMSPQEEFVYRIVQAALLQHDSRWSHLRPVAPTPFSNPSINELGDTAAHDAYPAPLHPTASLANYSFSSGRITQPLWMLASDDVVTRKVFSTPICTQIDSMLEALEASVATLLSMKKQLRSEITLLCFRVVSTVVDLLLPAAECRGKALTMFYRKWVCDVYRVLCQEHLLKGFTSLVHRAKLSSGNATASQVPVDGKLTEMRSYGSSNNIAGRLSPPQTNSPQTRFKSSGAAAAISAALGGSLSAAAGLFRRSSTISPIAPPTEFGAQLSSTTLRTSNRSFLREDVERSSSTAIPNASFDALDESTSMFPQGVEVGGINGAQVPNLNIEAMGSPRVGPVGEEALDEATAVGSLFRTFRRHNSVNDGALKSPTSATTTNGGGAVSTATTPNAAGAGGGSGSDSSVSAGAHQPTAVAETLFRSLHGDLCVPPTGCLGTRLMFTLLNGTDVTSFDFKDNDLSNTQHSGSAGGTPQHHRLGSNGGNGPLSPGLHHLHGNSSMSGEVAAGMLPRSRANSAAPVISPPTPHLPVSSANLTPRPLFPASADSVSGVGAPVSSTTSIVAMPHHHTFRYPTVRNVEDVRALYATLFHDAEVVLSPHDPLRAAITLNYAEFLALVASKRGEAADAIAGYLDEIEMEPIQPSMPKLVDLVGAPPASISAPSVNSIHPATTPSAFSVTNVRRAATSTAAPPPNPTVPISSASSIATKPAAVAAVSAQLTPIFDLLPSWHSKEERAQFVELVGLLKSARITLETQ